MKNAKKESTAGILLLLAFVVWTVLIQTVDVQPVGVNGTTIGLVSINTWFHKLTGVVTGIVLMVICSAVFILTRQPYAGIICFFILVVKGILISKIQ